MHAAVRPARYLRAILTLRTVKDVSPTHAFEIQPPLDNFKPPKNLSAAPWARHRTLLKSNRSARRDDAGARMVLIIQFVCTVSPPAQGRRHQFQPFPYFLNLYPYFWMHIL
jgi:hypothetical protein